MDFKAKYDEIMQDLKAGKRPYFKLSKEQFTELKQYYQKAQEQKDDNNVHHVHLILDSVSSYTPLFDELLYEYMDLEDRPEKLIFCLGAIQKQIIDRCSKEGERPASALFSLLRKLLLHKDAEVLEWALRVIEGLGPMSYSLKDDILKAKPSILGVFNTHKKASREIINVIIKNWQAYGLKV